MEKLFCRQRCCATPWLVMALVITGHWVEAAALQISQTSSNATVSWPTNAAGATLQFTDQLASSNGWPAYLPTRTTNGANLQVTDSSRVPARFFRLFDGGPPQPPQLAASGPALVHVGENAAFTLNFSDANGNIALLQIVQSNAWGIRTSSFPATVCGLGGTNGAVQLPLDIARLPFGPSIFSLQLRDTTSLTSAPVQVAMSVAGQSSGGSPPVLVMLTNNQPTSFDRPADTFDRLKLTLPVSFTDPDGDIYRIRIQLVEPGKTNVVEQSASTFLMAGTNGTASIFCLTWKNTNTLGAYTATITAIDRNGNESVPVSRTVQLVAFGGQQFVLRFNPAIFPPGQFLPTNGPAGTTVTLFGSFDTVSSNLQVSLNDVPVEILDAGGASLTVRIPEGAESGPFVVRSVKGGSAMSTRTFRVPPSVRVAPRNPPSDDNGPLPPPYEVPAGSGIQLEARVIPNTPGGSRAMNWFVNGISGGNASVGFISTNGLYTAPTTPAGFVTVTAMLQSLTSVSNSLSLLTLPTDTRSGKPVLVSAVSGGSAFSKNRRAAVNIAPGSLAVNTSIAVNEPAVMPTPTAGRRNLGAAEFLPDGTSFGVPANVTIPLLYPRPPGTSLRLRFYNPGSGAYLDEGILAIVSEAGDSATAAIPHFTIAVVDEPATNAPAAPPAILAIEPTTLREGERAPVRLTGTGLTADLLVEVLNSDGTPATDIVPETFLGRGTNAGALLCVGGIAGFDSGTRNFRLRVSRPGDPAAEIVFAVTGLPEILVGAGQTLELINPAPMTVSSLRVEAGGTLSVRAGSLDVECLGDVQIDGFLNAGGEPGGDGQGQQGGVPGREGHGGPGGLGREDSDGIFGLDGAEPENFGRNGNWAIGFCEPEQGTSVPYGLGDRRPRGIGGLPGGNLDLDPIGLVSKIAECVVSGGLVCADSAEALVTLAEQSIDIAEGGAPGKRGYGAAEVAPIPETGGGGGGGGGRIMVSVSVPVLDLASVSVSLIGGGGGAGGDGGRDVYINAQGEVVLGSAGRISAAGGDGGDGSATGSMVFKVGPFVLGRASDTPGLSGGAGGGGRAGNLIVQSGLGLSRYNPDQVTARGGSGGIGGVAYLDPANQLTRWQRAGNNSADGPWGKLIVHRSYFDPATFRPKVTSRLLHRLSGYTTYSNVTAADIILYPDVFLARNVTVTGEGSGQETTVPIGFDLALRRHDGFVLLYPGFNTISTYAAFPQRLLVIAVDSDNDGLSDDDESDLGTNPAVADTDGDGLNDGSEIVAHGDPLRGDTDGDGLSDGAEFAFGTRLDRADTDGDGFWDSAELVLGANPLIKTNAPLEMTPGLFFSSATHSNSPGGAYLAAINRVTGSFGLLGKPASGFGFGLAFDHLGDLYIADGTWLRIYNPLTQTAADVSEFDPINHTIQCGALAYNFIPTNRAFFGVELGGPPNFNLTGQLLRIDRQTGVALRIGAPLPQPIRALTFAPDGTLFAAMQDGVGADLLVELNPATGAITSTNGSLGVSAISGLAVTADGFLFGARPLSAAESQLLIIDPNTGLATPATTVARQLFGLAVVPCPVPCLTLANATNSAPVPQRLRAVDFNKDGNDDLIQIGWNGTTLLGNTATFYRSEGDGRFTIVTNRQLSANFSTSISRLAVGDLNNDTWPDLVSVIPDNSFSVVLNDGAGSFLAPQATVIPAARALALGEVTGDSLLDMILIVNGDAALYRGNGAGGFIAPTNTLPDAGQYVIDAKLADMNNDGQEELVLLDSAHIGVASRIGSGTFAAPVLTTVAYEGNDFAVADFDHDGTNDIALFVIGTPRGFTIHHGRGNGQFDAPVLHQLTNVVAGALLRDFAVGDFDHDGLPDLAFTEDKTGSIHLWMNDSPHGFRTARRSPLKGLANPKPAAVGDFNGDGELDVAAGDDSVSRRAVWLND